MTPMTATWRRLAPWALAAWFLVISATFILGPALRGNALWFGWDAVVYTHAARDLVAGGNPWMTEVFGIFFAAPPTGLLPFLPFIVMPDALVAGIWVAIAFASSIYSVRRLRLAWWWLLFPPLVIGISAGSSAPFVLALLVRAGAADGLREDVASLAANGAAVLLRPYTALPTLLLGRWRALAVAAAAVVLTAPFLGWGAFLADLPAISRALANQAGGGVSATVAPWLFVIAAIGLVALGRRRAAWLVVPALWPDAQLYYASIALPVLAEMPIVALAIASPATPGLIAIGIAAQAVLERVRQSPVSRRWARGAPPAPALSSSEPARE